MSCLRRCYQALDKGGRLAVLIGHVRRQGRYTPIVRDLLNFPYGEIRSSSIKVQHHCTGDRKTYGRMEDVPIRHEYCIVFKKTELRPSTESQQQLLSVDTPEAASQREGSPHSGYF